MRYEKICWIFGLWTLLAGHFRMLLYFWRNNCPEPIGIKTEKVILQVIDRHNTDWKSFLQSHLAFKRYFVMLSASYVEMRRHKKGRARKICVIFKGNLITKGVKSIWFFLLCIALTNVFLEKRQILLTAIWNVLTWSIPLSTQIPTPRRVWAEPACTPSTAISLLTGRSRGALLTPHLSPNTWRHTLKILSASLNF